MQWCFKNQFSAEEMPESVNCIYHHEQISFSIIGMEEYEGEP